MILAGMVSMVVGFQWNRIRTSNAYWSEEQANELTAAQVKLHELSHKRDSGQDASKSAEFIAARERVLTMTQKLDQARSSRSRTGTILIVAGITAVVSAAVLHYRRSAATSD